MNKSIIRNLGKAIKMLAFLFFTLAKIIFHLLQKAAVKITDKLRFSITFKITLTYALIFIVLSFFMSLGILVSFAYYIQKNPPQDYIVLLAIILGVFNLIGLFSIIFFGSKVSKKLLSPIKVMTNTVKEISFNALDKRLNVRGSKDELKDLAKTFNDMLNRIETSVSLQTQFVSDASHELRTPIAVISGYIDLLDRWGKEDRQVLDESIAAIKSETESMKTLIEKLLFLARGDRNVQKIEKQPFKMTAVLDEILKETQLIDLSHSIVIERNDDYFLYADQKLIKEAIRILVDNSIKYTPPGGTIKLCSYIQKTNAFISIEDTGIGIAKEDLPFIFNRFYRAEKSRTKKSGGTGLGLAIAKWIVDSHGGKIEIWSELNAGTVIRITLPLEKKNPNP